MKNITIKTVLIIEDEEPMLEVLGDKFIDDGFAVLKAKNGEEGLKIALLEHPDLIILDIIMPRMDGITMFKELRKDEWGRKAKVILLTALSDYKEAKKLEKEGVCEYFVKSDLNLKDLMKKVSRMFGEG